VVIAAEGCSGSGTRGVMVPMVPGAELEAAGAGSVAVAVVVAAGLVVAVAAATVFAADWFLSSVRKSAEVVGTALLDGLSVLRRIAGVVYVGRDTFLNVGMK